MLLTPTEILELTGGLTQPRRQLEELHRLGYERAALVRGRVILTRDHMRAVDSGEWARNARPAESRDTARPQLVPIRSAA